MDDEVKVDLTSEEMTYAAEVGKWRRATDKKKGRAAAYGAPTTDETAVEIDILGARGEFAFAKAMGLKWTGKTRFRGSDVYPFEVRTAAKDWYRLILHPGDYDNRPYVLVTQNGNQFTIHGWILGRDGKQDRYWADPSKKGRPAYWVPQDKLHAMEDWKACQE